MDRRTFVSAATGAVLVRTFPADAQSSAKAPLALLAAPEPMPLAYPWNHSIARRCDRHREHRRPSSVPARPAASRWIGAQSIEHRAQLRRLQRRARRCEWIFRSNVGKGPIRRCVLAAVNSARRVRNGL